MNTSTLRLPPGGSLFVPRIEAGMALLDSRHVGGWRSLVQPSELDINSIGKCVLGQVYGHYLEGMAALGLETNHAAMQHGFNSFCYVAHMPFRNFVPGYDPVAEELIAAGLGYLRPVDVLTHAWKVVLAA